MKKRLLIAPLLLLCAILLILSSCTKPEYTVDFIVDGEVYSSFTTSGREEIKIPADPTKEGYTFGGWYRDDGEWKKPFSKDSLLKVPLLEDTKIYAKWDCSHTASDWVIDKYATCEEQGSKHTECTVCGKTLETEEIAALGHDEIIHEAKAPTCTEIGWDSYVTCSRCDYTTYAEKSALGHTEVTDKAKAPSCTETGLTAGSHCSVCDTVIIAQEVIPANGHDFGTWETTKEPTEDKNGEKRRDCNNCEAYETEVIAPLSHDHTRWAEITLEAVAPTCTEAGLTEGKKCSGCGETLVAQQVIPALGHDEITHEAKAPTCTEKGWDAYATCSRCEYTTYAEKPALGHSSNAAVEENRKEATCTKDGSYDSVVYCGTCKAELSREEKKIESPGHTEVTDAAKAPTCTETGLTEGSHCSVCDTVIIAQEVIPANGHDFGTWETTKEPTEDKNGEKRRDCENCDAYETDIIAPLSHDHTRWEEITLEAVAPTCTKTGLTEGKKCSGCGEILVAQKEISALGHTPSAAVEENRKEATCTVGGSYDSVVYCSVCDAELSRTNKTISALGHAEVAHEAKAPTCTEIGWDAYVTCSRCDYTTYAEKAALGHTPGAAVEENRKEATCTVGGSYDSVVYCSVCDAELSRTNKTISALGHDEIKHSAKAPTCTEIGWDAYVTCSRCDYITYKELSATGIHSALNGACTMCNALESTPGLEYELNEDGTTYTVTGIGDCKETKIVIGIYNNRYVTSIGASAFRNCTSITSVTVENSITSIGDYAFRDATALVNIFIPESVTTIGTSVFMGCTKLANITVSDANTAYKSIDGCLYSGDTKAFIAYPAGKAASEFTMLEGVTTLTPYAFYRATKLVSITLSDDVSGIGSYSFYDCTSLENISLPDGIWKVGNYAFYNCNKLPSIIIPASVTKIGNYAFGKCKSLTNIGFMGTPDEWNAVTKGTSWDINTGAYTVTFPACVHSFGEWYEIEAPTCTENGSEERACVICGFKQSGELESLGHDEVKHNAKAPTCTEIGWDAYVTCSRCDYTTYTEKSALGHTPGVAVEENRKEATCTEGGSYDSVIYCSTCKTELSRTNETIAELGHNYTSSVIAPTCQAQGYTIHTCSRCSNTYKDSYVSALEHIDEVIDGFCDYGCGTAVVRDYVTYEEFGAVGDGKTNDFMAIYNAHVFANNQGLSVKASNTATYLISDTAKKRVPIATNVYWGTAKFIIDDQKLTPTDTVKIHDRHIFLINPETAAITVSQSVIDSINAKIKAGTLTVGRDSTQLDVGLGYAAMLLVTNTNRRVYIRYGSNANSGNTQQEIILIDKDGNIDPTTPFLLDYDEVTGITVYSINDTPITIDGGIFTTIAPDYNTKASGNITDYFDRGIDVRRSNVTVKNLTHYVENQQEYNTSTNPDWDPIPYHGFYTFSYAHNVRVENCVMTARSGHGTYDFSVSHCNNLIAVNCTMTNFFIDGDDTKPSVKYGYWGVMGSSYCKNVTFDSCELSRFDAHAGLYNGKILNSKVSLINIIGGGEMLIENTEIFYHRIVELRTDYGATWRGTIKIYDCKFHHNNGTKAYIFTAVWANHDFGYATYFPNVEIKDLEQTGKSLKSTIYFIRLENLTDVDNKQGIGEGNDIHLPILNSGTVNKNPMTPPEYITIISNKHNVKFVFDKTDFFAETEITGFP